ncbi:hypothetical protein [Saccharopolyspora rosea]|uniref:hypothetical protein n=1 Tax=Saccharopolyspora rosea TaxID=524884 RepID=UPI0021DB58D1|nr:hypothetical protein [Saccharopolyspora rosea]
MGRTGRVLSGLLIGMFLVFAPPAAASAPAPATTVVAQPPAQDPGSEQQLTPRQRVAIGVTGIVLIAAVLGSRRARKKPVFFVKWKK